MIDRQSSIISKAYESLADDPNVLKNSSLKKAVLNSIDLLDQGKIRVASPPSSKNKYWKTNTWIKKAILIYFRIQKMKAMNSGVFQYWDKIPLKTDHEKKKVRVVPPAVARYGSYIEPGAILMPSYINIGAYISENSMIDTWATVGSCAQIGKGVHISGGVGIGGVLEPPQAEPVIIEDHAFLGSRVIVVEGVHIEEGAVIGSGVILTASTKIVDVTKSEAKIIKGKVPKGSVVIPGTIPKKFSAGVYHVPCAMIIGKRKESTNKKTSLNDALREFNVSV